MFQIFNNIPAVTKNILILNILFFIVSLVLLQNGFNSLHILGGHYVNSPIFEPYQIITHFFMHSPDDFFHILFNMLMLVMFGSHLERIWGPKRFFIFYITAALGAFALYNAIGVYEIIQAKNQLISLGYDIQVVNNYMIEGDINQLNALINEHAFLSSDVNTHVSAMEKYISILTPIVGASGAIFGIMAAFAYLFPNTELMLLFPPIPVKAKYLIGIYFLLEVYLSFRNSANDNVAHLAHVGGAVVGFILVFIWNRKKDRFY